LSLFGVGIKASRSEEGEMIGDTFTTLDDPLGAQGTDDNGINDNNKIVGDYFDSNGDEHGFFYQHGTFTTLDDPLGVEGTAVEDINANKKIVGDYFDSNGVEHGFVYKHGVFTTLDDSLGTNGTVALSVRPGTY
jgi:hypothetical protein